MLLCILLAGCAASTQSAATTEAAPVETQAPETTVPTAAATEQTEDPAPLILPLPDHTLENLEDSILNICLEQGDFFRDASGDIYLRAQIFAYDQFDMVDIAAMQEGDRIRISGKVFTVDEVMRNEHGTVLINGGLDEGGFNLVTDDSCVFYVQGYDDMKSWNLICETDYLVSPDFVFTDHADLDVGERTYTAEDFLGSLPGENYGYTPQNTKVRIENGVAVAMERIYTP